MRHYFALPLLFLPVVTPITQAQPPDAPSTIKKPDQAPARGFVPPPDPAPITLEALQTLTGGPTFVTFAAQDVPLGDATKALFEAGKIPQSMARFFGENKKKVSVDWNQTPFWSAAADIEAQSGNRFDPRWGEGLMLGPKNEGSGVGLNGLLAAQTPFVRLIAGSIARSSRRVVLLGAQKAAPPESDSVEIGLGSYFDPKLQVQGIALRAVRFQKRGETAPVEGAENPLDFGFYGGQSNQIVAQTSLPIPQREATPGTNFSRISGVLHAVIVGASEPFDVPDVVLTPKVEKLIGAARYGLESAVIEGESLVIKVVATFGAAGNPARIQGANGSNIFANLRVRDAQGQELPRGGTSASFGGAKGSSELRFLLKNPKGEAMAGPFSLDWRVTTQLKSLDVPFELRDVVVP